MGVNNFTPAIFALGVCKAMGFSFVGRLLGLLLLLFSTALLPPIIVSLIYADQQVGNFTITLAAAFFESASAFTTTGATVFAGLDAMPHSLLFYRQELQWLGGIGVVVSAVALLPMLGVGGCRSTRRRPPGR